MNGDSTPATSQLPPGLHLTAAAAELMPAMPRADSAGHDARLGLVRVRRGVWANHQWWASLSERERAVQHHRAVALALPSEPLLCRESAALLQGLPLLHLPTQVHAITGKDSGSRRSNRDFVHHIWTLGPDESEVVNGCRVTGLVRTAVDCARELPRTDAVVVLDYVLHAGLDQQTLLTAVAGCTARRGVARARRAIAVTDPNTESVGETLTRLMLMDARLGGFSTQTRVRTPEGTYRLDFAWEDEKLALEFDGNVKYLGRYGSPEDVLRAERQREKALTNAGWRVIRTSWSMVRGRPDQVVGMIRAELRRLRVP